MINNNFLILFFIFPLFICGQKKEWDEPIKVIQNNKDTVDRIIYYESDGFALDKDSLGISNNIREFKDINLTLYHNEISMEPDVDYYVVGMDIPIMEFIELEEKAKQIILSFSRKCKPGPNDKKQKLELSFSSEKVKEDLYWSFEEILKIRDFHHQKLHELNQCKIGADY